MVNKELLEEIEEYCKLNKLDVKKTLNKALRGGFTILKFGSTPMSAKNEIKTVEVIKTVEKVVKVSDDTKTNELLNEITLLKEELKISNKKNKLDLYGE